MNHLNDEQLLAAYCGEPQPHLEDCELCRAALQDLRRDLDAVNLEIPERGDDYGSHVWHALEPRLHRPSWTTWKPWVAAAAIALIAASAFFYPRHRAISEADASQVRERVLMTAIGDHLERSQAVLMELANADASATRMLDITYERNAAEDLVEANRLYRQAAASSGDAAATAVLEDLERVLLEIAHSPARLSERELEDLQKQIEDPSILFKVKVFGSQAEQRAVAPIVDTARNKS